MKKTIITILLLTASLSYSQSDGQIVESQEVVENANKSILYEGTLVKAALKNNIRGGKLAVGDQIEFYLAQPIVVGDQVLVDEGAKILGSVTEARSSGVLGRKGKLAFDIQYLYLESGQVVKLSGENSKNQKGSGAVVVASAVVLTPLALLIPGKGANYKEGTVFDAYIAKDTELR